MSATIVGDCNNCGHGQTKHKGIDGGIRLESQCTDLQINEPASERLGRTVRGPLRCTCKEYITGQKERTA